MTRFHILDFRVLESQNHLVKGTMAEITSHLCSLDFCLDDYFHLWCPVATNRRLSFQWVIPIDLHVKMMPNLAHRRPTWSFFSEQYLDTTEQHVHMSLNLKHSCVVVSLPFFEIPLKEMESTNNPGVLREFLPDFLSKITRLLTILQGGGPWQVKSMGWFQSLVLEKKQRFCCLFVHIYAVYHHCNFVWLNWCVTMLFIACSMIPLHAFFSWLVVFLGAHGSICCYHVSISVEANRFDWPWRWYCFDCNFKDVSDVYLVEHARSSLYSHESTLMKKSLVQS